MNVELLSRRTQPTCVLAVCAIVWTSLMEFQSKLFCIFAATVKGTSAVSINLISFFIFLHHFSSLLENYFIRKLDGLKAFFEPCGWIDAFTESRGAILPILDLISHKFDMNKFEIKFVYPSCRGLCIDRQRTCLCLTLLFWFACPCFMHGCVPITLHM